MPPAILLFAVALLAAAPTPAADDTGILDQVQARYDTTRDFTAEVRQELIPSSGGKPIVASGTVAFQKPGKMRWTMTDGVSQVIVADGTTLWFYEPEEQQVLKAPFEAAFRSTTPISFLTGVGRLRDDFTARVERDGDGPLRLVLTPRREGELGTLLLSVDPASHDIIGAEITDPIGNVTRLRFAKLVRNAGIDPAAFRFEVPPGVDVVEAPIGN